MRLIEAYRVYAQVGKTIRKPTHPGKYENAALERRSRFPDIENQDTRSTATEKPSANYPVYKSSINKNVLWPKSRDLPVQVALREEHEKGSTPAPRRKVSEGLQVYRQVQELFSMPTPSSIEVLIRGADKIEVSSANYDELLASYRKRREEQIKDHERDLWMDFDPESMVYFDKPAVVKEVKTGTAGTVVNYVA